MKFVLNLIFLVGISITSFGQNLYRFKSLSDKSLILTRVTNSVDTIISTNNLAIDTSIIKLVIYLPGEFIRRSILLSGAAKMIDTIHGNRWELKAERRAHKKKYGIWSTLKPPLLRSLQRGKEIAKDTSEAEQESDTLLSKLLITIYDSLIKKKRDSLNKVAYQKTRDKQIADSIQRIKAKTRNDPDDENRFFGNLFSGKKIDWKRDWPIATVTFGLLTLILPTLIFFLYQYTAPPKSLKILLLGASQAGKSTVAYCLEFPNAKIGDIKEEKYTEGIFDRTFENNPIRYGGKRYIPRVIDLPENFHKKNDNLKTDVFQSPVDIVMCIVAINPTSDNPIINNSYLNKQSILIREYFNIVTKLKPKLFVLYINKMEFYLNKHPDHATRSEINDLKKIFYDHIAYGSKKAAENNITFKVYYGSTWKKWFTVKLFENLLKDFFYRRNFWTRLFRRNRFNKS